MRVTFGRSKGDIIIYCLIAAAVVCGVCFSVMHHPGTALLYLICGAFAASRISFKKPLVADILLPVITSVFAVLTDHLITSIDHDFYSGYHFVTAYLFTHDAMRFLIEIAFVAALYGVLRVLFVPSKVAAIIAPLPPMLISLTDYFVFLSRGTEFTPSDLSGAETAFSVIGSYSYPMGYPIMFAAVPFALLITGIVRLDVPKYSVKTSKREGITAISAAVLVTTFILLTNHFSKTGSVLLWKDEATQYNGFVSNFAIMVKSMKVEKPDGYDRKEMEALVNSGFMADTTESSNIIIIMNESLTDMDLYREVLGDFEEPMPFYRSLEQNTVKGYVYSSVYGGRTPNSEFEILTGDTNANLPRGAIPFEMYIDKDTYSIASYLRDSGYSTLGMHPYYAANWSRDTVFPFLGFDRSMFLDDFDTDGGIMREYVSDRCAYDNLINELGRSDKTFSFLVTMQNHGGYSNQYDDFEVKQYIAGDDDTTFQINTFMTLMNESDKALEYLVDYLSGQDEKYTLLIFGDHQPSLDIEGDFDLGGDKWMVPYLIWTNYDMPESLANRTENDTCINYLTLDVLQAAGVEYSPYFEYISGIRDMVPVINGNWYLDDEGTWRGFTDPNEYVDKYLCLQYYTLFD